MWWKTTTLFLVIAVALGLLQYRAYTIIPPHLTNHTAIFLPDLLSQKALQDLRVLIKEAVNFPANTQDLMFYSVKNVHIGEAQPILPDGSCAHRFLIPSPDKTVCILPGRIDVGRHWLRTGGFNGLKEPFESMVSRILSFGQYNFDVQKSPVVSKLFQCKEFQNAAKTICPKDKQVLDPFQYNFIIQIPGQTVAMHIDAPYFWGATRFQFPQWLLAVMVFSNLFQERFVDQVQIVSYLHETYNESWGGEFVYWDATSFDPKRVIPLPGAGSAIDGSKAIHAAEVYQPTADLPILSKDQTHLLKYEGEEKWVLYSAGKKIRVYKTGELRISIVYRARCFASEEDIEKFNNQTDFMTLEYILDKLKNDLVTRGRLAKSSAETISKLDLAILLLDEYVVYPYPQVVIPLNYCMLTKVAPAFKFLFDLIC